MATRMTINGVSTCTEAGTEKYEKFQIGVGRRKRTLVQYDYRHPADWKSHSTLTLLAKQNLPTLAII